jgi:VIT1/CCC1 family predicted Fe2+/Mn2+ transporter
LLFLIFFLPYQQKKMARSHHRKKHKQHLQQFKQNHETVADKSKGKTSATWVFGIAGAFIGFAVSYFASSGTIIWCAVGLIAGSAAGYFTGRRIDNQKN